MNDDFDQTKDKDNDEKPRQNLFFKGRRIKARLPGTPLACVALILELAPGFLEAIRKTPMSKLLLPIAYVAAVTAAEVICKYCAR